LIIDPKPARMQVWLAGSQRPEETTGYLNLPTLKDFLLIYLHE
jgi:hypothetical protein